MMQYQHQDNQENGSLATDDMDSIDSMLDKALLLSTGSDSDLEAARASRSQAEAMLVDMEREARRAGEDERKKLLAEVEREKEEADQLLEAAKRERNEAKRVLEEARKVRLSADEHVEKAAKEAERQKNQILDRARATGEKEAHKIRERSLVEVQKKLSELEALKEAAREELEARRLMTRAAMLRAKYAFVAGNGLEEETTDPAESEIPGTPTTDEKKVPATKQPQKTKTK